MCLLKNESHNRNFTLMVHRKLQKLGGWWLGCTTETMFRFYNIRKKKKHLKKKLHSPPMQSHCRLIYSYKITHTLSLSSFCLLRKLITCDLLPAKDLS